MMEENDGTWSHKSIGINVSSADSGGISILDPEYANSQYGLKNDYHIFGGFYAVTPIK